MTTNAEIAKDAIENVCSGREAERVAEVYHPEFHDHVNTFEFHGHDGARESSRSTAASSPTCVSSSTNRSPRATASRLAGLSTGPTVAGR